jgi:tetratricopeptide (TPR) repeat protein
MTRIAVIVVVVAIAARASAQPVDPTAADRARAGAEYFRVGNFEAALAEYRAAFELDRDAAHLYAMAAIEQQRGGCAAAIELYQQFIATEPPAEDIAAAEAAIEVCRDKLGISEPVPPEPGPTEAPVRRDPPPPATTRVYRPFYRDVLGDALAVGGLAGVITSGVFVVRARSAASSAGEPGRSQDEYDADWQRARDRRRVAWIAGGIGVALIAGAVVRWVTADRWREVPVDVRPTADGEGATVGVSARF